MRRTLWQRMVGLATVTGLGVVAPFAVGATPAYAQPRLEILKTHEGDFARGGQGVYRIDVSNTGSEFTRRIHVTDELPPGMRAVSVQSEAPFSCSIGGGGVVMVCNADSLGAPQSATILMTVEVAEDAPCTIVNRVRVGEDGDQPNPLPEVTDSDQTTITGGECGDGNGGNGNGDGDGSGSILPINLAGVLPMFNNITTNNNIDSPGASNYSRQRFVLNNP
ncbi:hypothetical protein ACGFYU_37795 [Streptomyces sp. NPDC048337]|uniref:hypothetical protein n=1 Tax=Streptomyces sp. NPDC048337 TaxID=3365535 RepID=UPI00370F961D